MSSNSSKKIHQKIYFGDSNFLISGNHNFVQYLSRKEIERMNKFRVSGDRNNYLIVHALLRKTLNETDPKLQSIPINYFDQKKPYLENIDLDFNLSHSDSLFAFVVANSEALNVGIDIEVVKPFEGMRDVALQNFSGKELSYVYYPGIIMEEQLMRFYEIWTRKEAFLKMIGLGLYTELTNISVTCEKNSVLIELPHHIKVKGDKAFIFTQRFSNFILSVSLSERCPVLFQKLES